MAQSYDSLFVKAGTLQSASGIWIPKSKHKSKPGLRVWLHGGMQSGNCSKGLQAGKAVFQWNEKLNIIVASPSVCRDQHWLTVNGLDAIESLIDTVIKRYSIDTTHITIIGVSDGGFGVINYSLHGKHAIAHRILLSTFAGAWVPAEAIAEIRTRVSNGSWTFLQGGHDTFFPASQTQPWMNTFCGQVPHCKVFWEDMGEHDLGWWTANRPHILKQALDDTQN
jgi:predicted peptidase